MSRDLHIVLSAWPAIEGPGDWVGRLRGWEADRAGTVTWVRRTACGGATPGLSMEGPQRVEAEDLLPDLAAAAHLPEWLTRNSVPAAASAGERTMALTLGRHIADGSSGILFGSQEDRIVWPRSRRQRLARVVGPRSGEVALQWGFAAGRRNHGRCQCSAPGRTGWHSNSSEDRRQRWIRQ